MAGAYVQMGHKNTVVTIATMTGDDAVKVVVSVTVCVLLPSSRIFSLQHRDYVANTDK